MTPTLLYADLEARVESMQADCRVNNEQIFKNMIEPMLKQAFEGGLRAMAESQKQSVEIESNPNS